MDTRQPNRVVDSELGTTEILLNKVGFDPDAKKPTVFTMESPLPEQGNDRTYLAHTDQMHLFLTVHAPANGEPHVHAHTNEDHAFIVMQGEATFFGPNEEAVRVVKHQGIMLPRGTMYRFQAENDEPLAMIRIGCPVDPDKPVHTRINADGTPMLGNASANNAVPTVFKPGAFFR